MSRIVMIPVAASWSYTLCCFGIGEVLQDLCVMVVSFSSLSRRLDVSISTCTKITFKSLSFSTPKPPLLPEITRHKNTFLLAVKCCNAERITTPQFGVQSVDMHKFKDKRLETLNLVLGLFLCHTAVVE